MPVAQWTSRCPGLPTLVTSLLACCMCAAILQLHRGALVQGLALVCWQAQGDVHGILLTTRIRTDLQAACWQ